MTKTARVAVIGAGMAGLSAVHHLARAGIATTVYEAGDEVGGRTRTTHRDGYTMDLGAITLSPAYRNTLDLIEEAGGGGLIERVRPVLAIVRDGRLCEIDLQRPLRSAARSGLLSRRATATLARLLPTMARYWSRCDFEDMSRLAALDTESCADFTERRLGRELLDRLVDPLIRVNMFNAPQISSAVDLVWLMKIFAGNTLLQVRGGMGAMSRTIAARLDVRTGTGVSHVVREGAGARIVFADGSDDSVDAVVVAIPPPEVARIMPELDGPLGAWFRGIEPVRSATVHLRLSRPPASRAAMIMVPTSHAPEVMGIVLDHNKQPDRAPPGKGLITVHVRDFADPVSETQLIAHALAALAPLFGDQAPHVEASHVMRWAYVDHSRSVGIYRQLATVFPLLRQGPIHFAGEYVSAGVEGAVTSGRRCAEAIIGGARGGRAAA